MNLIEYYNETSKTAVFAAEIREIYTWIGLANEFGELMGKYKKVLRGDKTIEESKEFLIDELGDCYWYLSEYAKAIQIEAKELAEIIPEMKEESVKISEADLFKDTLYLIGFISQIGASKEEFDATKVIHEHRERIAIMHGIRHAFMALACKFGASEEAVLDLNIAKLRDRQERGVIKGSGDKR